MTVSRTICLGFLILIAVGTLLLMLPWATVEGGWNHVLVALFTSTSAVCVTGLVVVDTGSYFSPFGQGVVLLLIQVGGLGYMTATTFLLLLLGRRLGLRDRIAIQQSMDKADMSGAKGLILSVIATTLLFELGGIVALMPVFTADYGPWRSLWLSIFHSISAFNNAGFGLFPDSLMSYARSPWINFVIALLVVVGGIGYQVLMEGYGWLRDRVLGNMERRIFSLHFKIVTSTTLFLLGLGTLALFATEFTNPATLGPESLNNKLIMAGFQSVITRTAGFNTIDMDALSTASKFLIIALMFVGASPGSTGGGIKTTTLRLLLICTQAVLRGKDEVLCFQRQIPVIRILKAIGVVVGSGITVVGVVTLISISDPEQGFINILFESVSAFATVGLSTGITADLSTFAQLLLALTMYVGRVGVLLMMAAILGDPKPSTIHYPEEDLLVG